MRNTARQPRDNRTITVDFHDEATSFQLLDDRKAFVECILTFLLALGFQLKHKATCGGGCLTRYSPYMRVRLGASPFGGFRARRAERCSRSSRTSSGAVARCPLR
jgi:hypothetical protein